jgi:LPS-assembly lipoprotein
MKAVIPPVRFFERIAVLFSIVALTACGFEPLNAKHANGSTTLTQTAQVKVQPIEYTTGTTNLNYRLTQQLRNELLDRLNPDGEPSGPAFELQIMISESDSPTSIDTAGTVQRSAITETAVFKLISLADNKPVLQGRSTGINSYGVITNSYATTVGRDDARKRAITFVADDIGTRLSLYFRRQAGQ